MKGRCSCTMGDLTNFGHKIQSLSILCPAFVKPLTMSNDCPSHVHIFVHKYNLCPKIWDRDCPTKKFGQSLHVYIQSLSRMCPHTRGVWLNWHWWCTFCPRLVHVQHLSKIWQINLRCPNFVQTWSMSKVCTYLIHVQKLNTLWKPSDWLTED